MNSGWRPLRLSNCIETLRRFSCNIRDITLPIADDPQPETILAQAREIYNSRVPLVGAGQSEDMIRTVSGLVLAPYVQLACERIMPRITQDAWHRGHCPVCGGAPSFAVLHANPPSAPYCARAAMRSGVFADWAVLSAWRGITRPIIPLRMADTGSMFVKPVTGTSNPSTCRSPLQNGACP